MTTTTKARVPAHILALERAEREGWILPRDEVHADLDSITAVRNGRVVCRMSGIGYTDTGATFDLYLNNTNDK